MSEQKPQETTPRVSMIVEGYAVDTAFSCGELRVRLWLDLEGPLADRQLSRYTPATYCCGSLITEACAASCTPGHQYPATVEGQELPALVGTHAARRGVQEELKELLRELGVGPLEAVVYSSLWQAAIDNFLTHERFLSLLAASPETSPGEVELFRKLELFCQEYNRGLLA